MIEWIYFLSPNIPQGYKLTPKDKLLLQNARFYEAFENADIEALASVWKHSNSVKCIHPGWQLLEGWESIRQSWVSICSSNAAMKISLRNVEAEIHGKLGIVTLVEEITYTTQSAIRTGAVVATNIFEFIEGNWKMLHHQGSPVIPTKEQVDDSFRYN